MCRTVSAFITRSRPIRIAAPGDTMIRTPGKKYAADVKNLIDLRDSGPDRRLHRRIHPGRRRLRRFPGRYLKHAYEHVRAAGGVCIADEVQAGFGRTGTHYWGFETQGVIPDIVSWRKALAMAARWRGRDHAEDRGALAQRIHFNTFGGNPVVSAHGQSRARSDRARKAAGELPSRWAITSSPGCKS